MRRLSLASVALGVVGLCGQALGEDPPANCTGSEAYRFKLQGSPDDGYTWQGGTVQVYAYPAQTIYVRFRTLMTVTSGQTHGWSFGVQHTNSWTQYYGGSVSLSSVSTNGTGTATVQGGSPPDTNHLQIRSGFNGFTQGVFIDQDFEISLSPVTDFVTAKACLGITAPQYAGTYPIDIKFSHDIGNPGIDAIITQGGVSKTVCANNLQLVLNATYSPPYPGPTPGMCNYYGAGFTEGGDEGKDEGKEEDPDEKPPEGNPNALLAVSGCFVRGDFSGNGTPDISDCIALLQHLFESAAGPMCEDAADGNDDGRLNITDPIFILGYLFSGLGPMPPPDYFTTGCGEDPTSDELGCIMGSENCTDDDGDQLSNCDEENRGTLPDDPDSDDDGFTDGEEVLETGVNGTSIAILGASPFKPDIFVEVDWFELRSNPNNIVHHHKPPVSALTKVVASFAAAPITRTFNGQVFNGITLHIDAGSVGMFNLPLTPSNGGAIIFRTDLDPEAVEHEGFMSVAPIDFAIGFISPMWNDFEALKTVRFGSNSQIFRYNLWCHYVHSDVSLLSRPGHSGVFTDDFIMAFGNDFDVKATLGLSDEELDFFKATTFMHELGHTLNLRHGGNEELPLIKPNYRSIMNQRYVVRGADRNCDGKATSEDDDPTTPGFDERLDFSRERLACLNEDSLDENNGICVLASSQQCLVNKEGIPECKSINWDNDDPPVIEPSVSVDISEDGAGCGLKILTGWDDWNGGTLRLDFRNSPNLLGPPDGLVTCPPDPATKCPTGGGAGVGSSEGFTLCPTLQELAN